jgi:hypothetical protein
MSVIVKVTCDRGVGDGSTCATTAWGRLGENVDETLEHARRAGWHVMTDMAGRNIRTACPWHTSGAAGGTGPS